MQPYRNEGPVQVDKEIDYSNVKDKSVVITGGANGIGEAYVRSFVKAGAFVTIGDLDDCGEKLATEHSKSVRFVKCDVTQWKDQLELFRTALSSSPSGRVDIVIANAGISGPDSIFVNDDNLDEPEEPKLKILDVNLIGVMYTTKLALHYFQKQKPYQDSLLILQGSLAGYGDQAGSIQYCAAKWGLRGTMRCLRRTSFQHGTRVNYIAPWIIRTKILSPGVIKHLESYDVEFATVEDAAAAVMRFAGDKTLNGRTLAIVPRSWSPTGYIDYDLDDYDEDHQLGKAQQIGLSTSYRITVPAKNQ